MTAQINRIRISRSGASQLPEFPILPGCLMKVWRFSGELVKGSPGLPGLRPIRRVFSSSSVTKSIICTLRSLQTGSCAI
jgi:hypothetical protein